MIRPSVYTNWYISKLSSYPPQRLRDRVSLFFDDYILKRCLLCHWGSHSWVVKPANKNIKYQRGRERV